MKFLGFLQHKDLDSSEGASASRLPVSWEGWDCPRSSWSCRLCASAVYAAETTQMGACHVQLRSCPVSLCFREKTTSGLTNEAWLHITSSLCLSLLPVPHDGPLPQFSYSSGLSLGKGGQTFPLFPDQGWNYLMPNQ